MAYERRCEQRVNVAVRGDFGGEGAAQISYMAVRCGAGAAITVVRIPRSTMLLCGEMHPNR